MISDEPDEGADSLDDEALLESYLGVKAPKRQASVDSGACMPDWPPSIERELGLNLDAGTIAWFKANHGDWRASMAGVLRAWVAARTRKRPDTAPTG
jgi:uncharacterized protein (DUF4415 family)